jgi:iron complex transport system permease protein
MSERSISRKLAKALLAPGAFALLAMTLSALVHARPDGGVGALGIASPGELFEWLAGSGDGATIFWTFRLPRLLAAALIGASLAAAGCAFQATLRNPLAEPYTLGVSSGASLGAVIAIRLGAAGTLLGTSAVSLAAFAGASAAVFLVWRLGRVGRSLPAATLLLAGITIAMFCSALALAIQHTSSIAEVYRMVRWLMGDLDGILMDTVSLVAPLMALCLLALLFKARDLNAMAAGDDAAASLGVSPQRTTTLVFALSSLLVGASIALAGPIGFIGLMVPHAMRAVVGADHRWLLPASTLAGAGLLVLCDLLARTIAYPNHWPVGILTALAGAPFFLFLLLRQKRSGLFWGG